MPTVPSPDPGLGTVLPSNELALAYRTIQNINPLALRLRAPRLHTGTKKWRPKVVMRRTPLGSKAESRPEHTTLTACKRVAASKRRTRGKESMDLSGRWSQLNNSNSRYVTKQTQLSCRHASKPGLSDQWPADVRIIVQAVSRSALSSYLPTKPASGP